MNAFVTRCGVMAIVVVAADGVQQRDTAARFTAGTATIAGTVVDDQQPPHLVRRAVVTLTGDGLSPNRGAITDDQGQFTIRSLPSGRFTLMAERGGYITSSYGAKRPGRPGTEIVVAAGQTIADVSLRIWRGASISGFISDAAGAPLANTPIEVLPAREVILTGLTLSNRAHVLTNDRGEFRAFGLPPGAYLVRAVAGQAGITELVSSEAEIDSVFAALRARSKPNAAMRGSDAHLQVPSVAVTGAPIYFPGTPDVAEATVLTVGAGEERDGVDFSVRNVRTATIRGTVSVTGVAPAGIALVELAPATSPSGLAGLLPQTASQDAAADGHFALGPVSPGNYQLLVRSAVRIAGSSVSRVWWARQTLSVNGGDIDLGVVNLQPGLMLSGRVTIDSMSGGRGPDLETVRVELQGGSFSNGPSRSRSGGASARLVQPGIVRADGTFEITNLVPDIYKLGLTGLTQVDSNWWLRSAMWNGRDLLDEPLRLEPDQDVRDVSLVLSNRHTELSGILTSAVGTPASNVFVLVFPAEQTQRRAGSRRVKAVRPDSGGRFIIDNLPAGDYLLCALIDTEEGEWNDPGFLDSLVRASLPVRLADGETKVQNLRLAGG